MTTENLDSVIDETVIDEPMEDESVIDESVVDEPAEEIDTEELTGEPAVEPPKPNDSVPLTKYMQEKKRRQELEKVLSQQSAEREKLSVAQDYINRGYPESEALNLAQKDTHLKTELETLKSRFQDNEIKDLARNNDFYSDAESFSDEIKEKMKTLGISAKDSYMLLRGESRTYEMRQKQEQLSAVKRKQVISKKVTTASPVAPSNPYKLDDNDKKALAELQKAQPDAKWSSEKYFKLMKS